MARIAIVGGVQTRVMFAGFPAGRNAVAIRTIFYKSSVVYSRPEKCSSALVTNTTIGRSDHVANVLAFGFNPVVTGRATAGCLGV